MTYVYRSAETDPFRRGQEFGAAHATRIEGTITGYSRMFDAMAGAPFALDAPGTEALAAIDGFAPHLGAEIRGMADGAGLPVAHVAAINARTEILALIGARTRGECSAVIVLPAGDLPPVAVQTWDWYQQFASGWLVWEIPHADGTETRTMTEYGIVGKSGMNTRGLGLLFTILHHQDDGRRIGVPVHVAARAALDLGKDINRAAQVLARAQVSASSSINLFGYEAGVTAAISVELFPGGPGFVLPDRDGVLVHTNHFLADTPARGDLEPGAYPDTLIRRNLLLRRINQCQPRSNAAVIDLMSSHLGTVAAVCCHHDPAGAPDMQYETLTTVAIDLAAGQMTVHGGGPCTFPK